MTGGLTLAAWLMASLLSSAAPEPPCPDVNALDLPPGLGGVAPFGLELAQAEQWQAFRRAREQARFREAIEPAAVRASYRSVTQSMITGDCIPPSVLIDLGRALFIRNFTPAEGLGNHLAGLHPSAGAGPRPNRRRLGAGTFGGPEALSCKDCHWRGGMAGGGDRADNVFMGGQGDSTVGQEELQAPALWGSGWIELLAEEMSAELSLQRNRAMDAVRVSNRSLRVNLRTKGVDFGSIEILPSIDPQSTEPSVDYQHLRGIDQDLIVRPFGWRGRYQTIRQSVIAQSHLHLGLQADELMTHGGLIWIDPGLDRAADPDDDGVVNELTAAQVSAISSYLATLRPPRTMIPMGGPEIGQTMTAEIELLPSSEWIHRWGEGARQFQQLGCDECHRPYLELENSVWSSGPGDEGLAIDLVEHVESEFSSRRRGKLAVPVFSDFRRHAMGEYLEQRDAMTGTRTDIYLTRPLWGLASSAPWMHDGRATTLDEAILLHGGRGSDALVSARAFEALSESERSAVRVYLMSLRRPPSIRIR